MDIIRSRRSANLQSAAVAASRTLALLKSVPYGYSNTFHTRATDALPPTYNDARLDSLKDQEETEKDVPLPPYTCTVWKTEAVDILCEFEDPFKDLYQDTRWRSLNAVLEGTKISFFCTKKSSKLVHVFSLQHAEVGLAVDLRHGPPIPKSPLLELLPTNLRTKLYETKPHLFEPIRLWCLRLRVEGRQILLSYQSESIMLDWVELLCAAIDISAPIDDRSLPKYRSLPRRSRRQRQLESVSMDDAAVGTNDLEGLTRQLIRQQQRILDSLYPDLGSVQTETDSQNSAAVAGAGELSTRSTRLAPEPAAELERITSNNQDPDMDDLDPADVMDDSMRPMTSAYGAQARFGFESSPPSSSYDPKSESRNLSSNQSRGNSLKYRRRCAPIMNKFSPWASDVIFVRGMRLRIDRKRGRFIPFEVAPPKYSALVKAGAVSPVFAAMGAAAAAAAAKEDGVNGHSEATSAAISPTTTGMSTIEEENSMIMPERRQAAATTTDVLKRAVVTVVDMEDGYMLEASTSVPS